MSTLRSVSGRTETGVEAYHDTSSLPPFVRPSKDQPHSAKSNREGDYNYYNCGYLFPVHVTSHSVSVDQIQVRLAITGRSGW